MQPIEIDQVVNGESLSLTLWWIFLINVRLTRLSRNFSHVLAAQAKKIFNNFVTAAGRDVLTKSPRQSNDA